MPRKKSLAGYVEEAVTQRYVAGERPSALSPRDVSALLAPLMAGLEVEEMRVLCLDGQNRVCANRIVSRGILNTSVVHPREVFALAIDARAAAIILVHNHPSGVLTPSPDDIMVTEQMVKCGKILQIPIYDHIIIGSTGYYSFQERGDFPST